MHSGRGALGEADWVWRAPQLAYTEASCCRTVRFVPSSAQGLGRNYLPAANRPMPHLSLAPMRMGVRTDTLEHQDVVRRAVRDGYRCAWVQD